MPASTFFPGQQVAVYHFNHTFLTNLCSRPGFSSGGPQKFQSECYSRNPTRRTPLKFCFGSVTLQTRASLE